MTCACITRLFIVFAFISILLLVLVLIKVYVKLTTSWCYSRKCLVGKTVIITGANTGIGYETARNCAMRGAQVILACRDAQKAAESKRKLIEETGNENITVKTVDLVSFDSVRKFAKDINSSENRLDLLVNNAGLGSAEQYTAEGHVFLYQINYYSHFLLTILLLELLQKSKPSRIINVSSIVALQAKFNPDKMEEYPGFYTDYTNSKLLQILFTKELAKRLGGTGVTTFSVHPGIVNSEYLQKVKPASKLTKLLWKGVTFIAVNTSFLQNCEEGAQTTLYAALENGLENYNGEHFSNCNRVETYSTAKLAPGVIKNIWKKTEDMVQLTPEEKRILL